MHNQSHFVRRWRWGLLKWNNLLAGFPSNLNCMLHAIESRKVTSHNMTIVSIIQGDECKNNWKPSPDAKFQNYIRRERTWSVTKIPTYSLINDHLLVHSMTQLVAKLFWVELRMQRSCLDQYCGRKHERHEIWLS